ncbi:MAG TPA: NAD-dependent epimerase/dehydratase family protein [Flavitalea sp.]|nr:NAD-dependent epimerase/dehydratase family protein [Flavitalea sp.]
MTVGLTGANGFVGAALALACKERGFHTVRLMRNKSGNSVNNERLFDLEKPMSREQFTGIDILVHCAFIDPVKKNAEQLDSTGTANMMREAQAAGVKKFIYFSSVSGYEETLSDYGHTKLVIEKLFDPSRDVIVKPALIIGKNGLFYRMLQQALQKKFVPLVNGGNQPMQVIALEDVVSAVLTILDKNLNGLFVLANRENFTYKEMFERIAKAYNISFRWMNLPYWGLNTLLTIAGLLRMKLPVTKENIKGLQSLRFTDPETSLQALNLNPKNFDEMLRELKADKV